MRLILGEGLRMAFLGVAIGLVGALALSRLLADLLFGISAADPVTFAGVAILLTAIAIAACYTRRGAQCASTPLWPCATNETWSPTCKSRAVPERNLYLRTACGLPLVGVTFSRTWPRFGRQSPAVGRAPKIYFEIFLCRNLRDFSKDISRPTLCLRFVTRDGPGQDPGTGDEQA